MMSVCECEYPCTACLVHASYMLGLTSVLGVLILLSLRSYGANLQVHPVDSAPSSLMFIAALLGPLQQEMHFLLFHFQHFPGGSPAWGRQ